MNNKTFSLISIVITFLSFDTYCQKRKFTNMKILPQMEDVDSVNILNQDNKIFLPNRVFTYSLTHINSSCDTSYFFSTFDPNCKLNKTKCIDWHIGSPNTLDTNVYIIDTVKLYVYQGVSKLMSEMSKQQTIIKYEYFTGHDRFFIGELTGVIEDTTKIFLHPPRSNGLIINELNPFPEIKLPIKIRDTWRKELYISNPILKSIKIKDIEELDGLSVKFTYTVDKEHFYQHNTLGKLKCYRVKGVSDKYFWGQTSIEFDFSPKYGFLNIEYNNYNKSRTYFKLENIK